MAFLSETSWKSLGSTRRQEQHTGNSHAKGPCDYITMGGMFTVLKVRDKIGDDALTRSKDPGCYDNPPGTFAMPASDQDVRRDGISL